MRTPTSLNFLKAARPAPPVARRPIGFRGNHQHKKTLYDVVYPTTKVPAALIPRYPTDWRNGGRMLLIAALARLEGIDQQRRQEELQAQTEGTQSVSQQPLLRVLQQQSDIGGGGGIGRRSPSAAAEAKKGLLLRHRQFLDWQSQGFCFGRCRGACSKEMFRCLCAWRCTGRHEHIMQMDALLASFKGEVKTQKPLFSVLRRQARRNKTPSEAAVFDPKTQRFCKPQEEQLLHPAFAAFDRASAYPYASPSLLSSPCSSDDIDNSCSICGRCSSGTIVPVPSSHSNSSAKGPPRTTPPLPFYSASHVPAVPHPPPPEPYTGPLPADGFFHAEGVSSDSSCSDGEEGEVRITRKRTVSYFSSFPMGQSRQ